MMFYSEMLPTILTDLAAKKEAYNQRVDLGPERTVKMINGTVASIYSVNLGRLIKWPYADTFNDDYVDRFLMSNQSQAPLLYHFIDDTGVSLYIGKALRGVERSLDHIYAIGSHSKALHHYIVESRARSAKFLVVYYALTLSPTLPYELKERTVLACESTLIKHNPTMFNVMHNQRQET